MTSVAVYYLQKVSTTTTHDDSSASFDDSQTTWISISPIKRESPE
jgi:hypothetical protein